MKSLLIASLLTIAFTQAAFAADDQFEHNRAYAGADATKAAYKVIYQLDTNQPDTIKKAIRNINNLLEDPRLKDKLEVELIAFSGGTEALMKSSAYESALKDLIAKKVIVAQCLNSLKDRKLDKSQFYDFIGYVPSGNGELSIRGAEGWVIIKP